LTTGAHDPEQFVEPIRSYLIAKAGYSEESFAPPPPAEVDTPRKKIVRLLLSDRVWLILVGIALVGPFLRSYIPGIRYLGNSGTMRKGIELYQRQQYTEALPYFQRAAEGGNTQAMTNLALIYEEGRGVPKDERKAVELYTKAINDSDNPDSQAMVNLGVMYLNGQGALPKGESKALELFKKAAEADNANGMAMLGAMYEDGAGGLPKDMATALSWYKKSAKKGNEFAQKHLKELQGGTSPQSQ
jgi:TPR repeat protein